MRYTLKCSINKFACTYLKVKYIWVYLKIYMVLIMKEALFVAISVKTHSICTHIFITHIFATLIC